MLLRLFNFGYDLPDSGTHQLEPERPTTPAKAVRNRFVCAHFVTGFFDGVCTQDNVHG